MGIGFLVMVFANIWLGVSKKLLGITDDIDTRNMFSAHETLGFELMIWRACTKFFLWFFWSNGGNHFCLMFWDSERLWGGSWLLSSDSQPSRPTIQCPGPRNWFLSACSIGGFSRSPRYCSEAFRAKLCDVIKNHVMPVVEFILGTCESCTATTVQYLGCPGNYFVSEPYPVMPRANSWLSLHIEINPGD